MVFGVQKQAKKPKNRFSFMSTNCGRLSLGKISLRILREKKAFQAIHSLKQISRNFFLFQFDHNHIRRIR